jgi:hypothetical protein
MEGYQYARTSFFCEPPRRIYGARYLAEAVEVFELVGASAVRRCLQAGAARGLTRFVGQETEMAALIQALARAGAGRGQVVAAVGEAGVGKSRLRYEFIHFHHAQGWLVLEAASVSYGKATPISRLSICSGAICTSRTETSRAPFGPRSRGTS